MVILVLLAGCQSGGGETGRAETGGGATGGGATSGGGVVRDNEAGLSYTLPSGWEQQPSDDLLDFFTGFSHSPKGDPSNEAIIATGLLKSTVEEGGTDLGDQAEGLAISMAEFFVPFTGKREMLEDEELQVAGRDAHRYGVKIVVEDGGVPDTEVHVVTVDLDEPAYVVGVVPSESDFAGPVKEALDSLDAA